MDGDATASTQKTNGSLAYIAMYFAATLVMVAATGWPLAYPLDDTYIHLAIARTLATSGVWGVQTTDPAAASSSPLWTLLLAGAYLAWPAVRDNSFLLVPLILNLLAGVGVVWLWHKALAGVRWRPAWIFLFWCMVPLSAMSLVGMEHVLHVLFATGLALAGALALADDTQLAASTVTGPRALAGLAAVAVAARYESLFLVIPLVAFGVLRGRFGIAVALLVGAIAPVLGFGAFWIAQGGWLLPNPIQLKGLNVERLSDVGPASFQISSIDLLGFSGRMISNLTDNLAHRSGPPLLVIAMLLLGLAVAEWWRDATPWRWRILLGATAVITTLLHLTLARVGWLYRYEAWLVALDGLAAVLLLDPLLCGQRHRQPASILCLALLAGIFGPRAVEAMTQVVQAADDRRIEHLLPAEFVRRFYAGRTVVANDIGAVAYLGDVRVLDLVGLGSNVPLRLWRQPEGYDAAGLRRWAEAEGAMIAVVQPCWHEVHRRLPPEWRFVAVWQLARNVVFPDYVVGYLAIAPGEEERLRTALEAFRPPATIKVRTTSEEPALAAFMAAPNRRTLMDAIGCHP